jgi:hypothetical protein
MNRLEKILNLYKEGKLSESDFGTLYYGNQFNRLDIIKILLPLYKSGILDEGTFMLLADVPTIKFDFPQVLDLTKSEKVPYASICPCNPLNGGSGICGCTMGNTMVDKRSQV